MAKFHNPLIPAKKKTVTYNFTEEQLRQYQDAAQREGWVLDTYPEWKDPTVHAWAELPDPPEETEDVCEACQITYSHERDGDSK